MMAIERRALVTPYNRTERTTTVLSVVGSACEALRTSTAVGPITISLPLGIMSETALRKLGFRIAERYKLRIEVEVRAKRGVVRLRRSEGS
jgi:hypothetical protein